MKTRYLIFSIIFLAITYQPAHADQTSLPAWLKKTLAEQRNRTYPYVIEEVTYDNKRAFEFDRTDEFDTGDEHILKDKEGKEICKFGGYVGRVTSGLCDIDKIKYVRTLTPSKK